MQNNTNTHFIIKFNRWGAILFLSFSVTHIHGWRQHACDNVSLKYDFLKHITQHWISFTWNLKNNNNNKKVNNEKRCYTIFVFSHLNLDTNNTKGNNLNTNDDASTMRIETRKKLQQVSSSCYNISMTSREDCMHFNVEKIFAYIMKEMRRVRTLFLLWFIYFSRVHVTIVCVCLCVLENDDIHDKCNERMEIRSSCWNINKQILNNHVCISYSRWLGVLLYRWWCLRYWMVYWEGTINFMLVFRSRLYNW